MPVRHILRGQASSLSWASTLDGNRTLPAPKPNFFAAKVTRFRGLTLQTRNRGVHIAGCTYQNATMSIDQLLGRQKRLEREIAAALAAAPLAMSVTDRLSRELAETICELAALEARSAPGERPN